MNAPLARSLNPVIRDVNRQLIAARDAQIERVVAMVDAMPVRGQADEIVAPLRPRLARLRPPRPLRFARLMFLPLDPVIVPAPRWRPGAPSVPRTAIPVLAEAVRAALGPAGQQIDAMIAGRTTRDQDTIAAAGAILWPAVPGVLLSLPAPPAWEATGLGLRAYKPLAQAIAALLSQAVPLRQLTSDAGVGLLPPDARRLQSILAGAAAIDPEIMPIAIALLLARVPESAQVLARVTASLDQRQQQVLRKAEEEAANVLLDQLAVPGGAESHLGGRDLAAAGAAVRRLTGLLTALEGDGSTPGRRDAVAALRRRVQANCQSLFAERLATDLLEPLHAGPSPRTAQSLEAAARGLRALETEALRAGGGAVYHDLLSQAASSIRTIAASGVLGPVGGVRLVEILAGPDEALALLGIDGELGLEAAGQTG